MNNSPSTPLYKVVEQLAEMIILAYELRERTRIINELFHPQYPAPSFDVMVKNNRIIELI